MFFFISSQVAYTILHMQTWWRNSTYQAYEAGAMFDTNWCLDTGAKLGVNHEGRWYIYGYSDDGHDLLPYVHLLPAFQAKVVVRGGYEFAGLFDSQKKAETWCNGWRNIVSNEIWI